MNVTIKIAANKPSNVDWFPQSSEANKVLVQSLNQWSASQPGFISQTTENPTPDSRIVTIMFDNVENYVAWMNARSSRPEQVARESYNNINGIASTLTEIIT